MAQPQQAVQDRLIAPPTGRRIRLSLILEVPAVVVTMVMMVHITVNALLRTFASAPIDYTLEITEYWYMPIIVFLGFVAAQMRGEHVKADFIFNLIPVVTRRFVLGIAYICITLTCLGFAWYGWQEALHALSVRRLADISPVPAWPTTFLAPFAFGIMTVQFAMACVQYFRGHDVIESTELDDLEVELETEAEELQHHDH